MAEETKAAATIMLPEGRLINHSLFKRDVYTSPSGQEGNPLYKVEIAFDKGALDGINNDMLDFANEKWGAGAEENVVLPIKDGDAMAKTREENGKAGDAYAGKDVLRANTKYNRHGEEDAGGISVYAEDGETEIGIANQSEVYQGCMVIAAVTFSGYVGEDPRTKEKYNAITLYLKAVQKTGDGERLVSQTDNSKLFKPVGRKPAAEGEAVPRNSRAG
jgi:hypothetical protein